MLLRVLRPLSGSVDGIDLTRFEAGQVYRFSTGLAAFLLAIAAAEPIDADDDDAVTWPARPRIYDIRRPSPAPQPRWTGPERRQAPRI